MNVIIEEVGVGTVPLILNPIGHPALSKLIPTQSWQGTGNFGEGMFDIFDGCGFMVSYSKWKVLRDSVLNGFVPDPTVELRFMLGLPLKGEWDGFDNAVLLTDQFSLAYAKQSITRAVFAAGEYETLDIHFEIGYLERLRHDFPLLNAFLDNIQIEPACQLTAQHYYCSEAMRRAIRELLRSPFTINGQKYLLEAKVLELLVSALEVAHDRSANQSADIKLTAIDIEALHEVKRRIENFVDSPPPGNEPLTYAKLQKVGISENKLLNGFKKLFGTTPYQYQLKLKMDKAAVLLLTSDESIAEIAYIIGYEQGSNFSLEFRKQFGCSPQQYQLRHRGKINE